MQDADPYPLFERRSEGSAEVQRTLSDLNANLQQQGEDAPGEPASPTPGASGLRDGNDGEVAREMTQSESGEGMRVC